MSLKIYWYNALLPYNQGKILICCLKMVNVSMLDITASFVATKLANKCTRKYKSHQLLQCTSRFPLALAVSLKMFSAEHQYCPDWFLLAVNVRVSPEATTIPSLYHVRSGVGFPVALQRNDASWPSMTEWDFGVTTQLGGTRKKKVSHKKEKKIVIHNTTLSDQCVTSIL